LDHNNYPQEDSYQKAKISSTRPVDALEDFALYSSLVKNMERKNIIVPVHDKRAGDEYFEADP